LIQRGREYLKDLLARPALAAGKKKPHPRISDNQLKELKKHHGNGSEAIRHPGLSLGLV